MVPHYYRQCFSPQERTAPTPKKGRRCVLSIARHYRHNRIQAKPAVGLPLTPRGHANSCVVKLVGRRSERAQNANAELTEPLQRACTSPMTHSESLARVGLTS